MDDDILRADEALCWLEGVTLTKTDGPGILSVPGFLRSILRVARRVIQVVRVAAGTREFRRRVRNSSDIDWRGASPEDRTRAVDELGKLVAGFPSNFAPGVEVVLREEGRGVVLDTRRDVGRQDVRLKVDPVFNLKDERAVNALASSSAIFYARQYETQADRFRERAQDVLTRGLDSGLGRREIAADLRAEFDDAAIPESYFETVAANHVARARTFSALATYAEAGLEEFEWVSILDSRTTNVCSELSGRKLSIETALNGFDQVEASRSLEAVKLASPLVDPDATADEFLQAGGFAPPAHHRCRSVVAAVFPEVGHGHVQLPPSDLS